jgi:hypothetical protein
MILILRSGLLAASRRMAASSWFETAQERLLTMRKPRYELYAVSV